MLRLHTVANVSWLLQILVSAFFAILFLQSAIDKIVDRRGNLEFLQGHFAKSPLAGMVPPFATAPVLILVGAAMFRSVAGLSFKHLEDSLPVFLTIILIPLTFSITEGILWGFISHTALYLLAGRHKEIHPVMYALSVISIGLLALEHGKFS